MRLEMREWEASRSRTESPWSASRRRLSESRLDAARALRSSTVDMEMGVGAANGDASAERGDLVLGVATGDGEAGGGKPRPTATGDGDGDASLLADGDEEPEREAGLGFALGLALALALGLGLGLEAAAGAAAFAFLMAASICVQRRGGFEILNFEREVSWEREEGRRFIAVRVTGEDRRLALRGRKSLVHGTCFLKGPHVIESSFQSACNIFLTGSTVGLR
jgi:hypothetical protein